MTLQLKCLSVTGTASSHTFSPAVNKIIIKNVGSNPIYFNLNDTATTDHFRLDVEEILEIGLIGITSISAICDSSKTSKLNISGN